MYEGAACKGMDPAIFYREDDDPLYESDTARAKATCLKCPVMDACRVAGANEDYGIWAGQTPEERKQCVKQASPI